MTQDIVTKEKKLTEAIAKHIERTTLLVTMQFERCETGNGFTLFNPVGVRTLSDPFATSRYYIEVDNENIWFWKVVDGGVELETHINTEGYTKSEILTRVVLKISKLLED